jgi:hypothetical protein
MTAGHPGNTDSTDPHGDAERIAQGVGHGIGLHHVADTEGGDGRKEGEQGPQEASDGSPNAPRKVVHGAAGLFPPLVGDTVADRKESFGVLRRHPDEARHPHPEQSTGPSKGDRRGHAGDVSGADGRRQGRHQRLEVGNVARRPRLFADDKRQVQGMPQCPELEAP